MNFEEALAYMEGRIRFGWKLGLERFAALCERLGHPERRYAIVHIAGTKGKGSTTALAAAILREAGYVVGGYFSPYVYDVRERVVVSGEPIPAADFARLVTEIRPHIEALEQTELGAVTEFELKTAVAFCYFAEQGVEFACIEVGIGGRLDATNVVQPAVTVITNIGLDHTAILGDTHALIAAEKAGILKTGVPCFTATAHPEALEVITRIAAERQVPLARVERGDAARPTGASARVLWQSDGEMSPVTIATPTRVYVAMPMQMGGAYQRENAACAVAAAETALNLKGANLSEDAVRRALANTALPGRLTIFRLPDGPLVVLDGAHNGLAAQNLVPALAELREQHHIERTLLILGMLGGHDPDDVLAPLAADAERLYATQPTWRRALPAEEIERAAHDFVANIETIPSVEWAVRAALANARRGDMILITGSFFVVGEAPPAKIAAWFAETQRREN